MRYLFGQLEPEWNGGAVPPAGHVGHCSSTADEWVLNAAWQLNQPPYLRACLPHWINTMSSVFFHFMKNRQFIHRLLLREVNGFVYWHQKYVFYLHVLGMQHVFCFPLYILHTLFKKCLARIQIAICHFPKNITQHRPFNNCQHIHVTNTINI